MKPNVFLYLSCNQDLSFILGKLFLEKMLLNLGLLLKYLVILILLKGWSGTKKFCLYILFLLF